MILNACVKEGKMVDENVCKHCTELKCKHAGEPTTKERLEQRVFPIITKSLQEEYEKDANGIKDTTPEICGCYGRACRQLNKTEGANRALCYGCDLAEYCKDYR